MPDSIGAMQFMRIDGEIQPSQISCTNISQPGKDGIGIRKDSIKPVESELETLCFAQLPAGVEAVVAAAKALQATLVTVTIRSNVHPNIFIWAVEKITAVPVINQINAFDVSGAPVVGEGYLVRLRWTVQYAGT